MRLAEGRPLRQRLMAAMGQLDCGQCGYDCRSYAEKLADGSETKTSLCVPGGRRDAQMLESSWPRVAGPPAAAATPAPAPAARRGDGRDGELKAATPLNAPGSEQGHAPRRRSTSRAPALTYEPGDCPGRGAGERPGAGRGRRRRARRRARRRSGCRRRGRRSPTLRCRLDLRQLTDALLLLLPRPRASRRGRGACARWLDGEDPDGAARERRRARPARGVPLRRGRPRGLGGALDELQPRLYSISSSPAAHPDEVHLTVGVVRERAARPAAARRGLDLPRRAAAARARRSAVYRQPSHGFRLPLDPAVPIVMVGPGTGIAPFRAFLEARAHQAGARGRAGCSSATRARRPTSSTARSWRRSWRRARSPASTPPSPATRRRRSTSSTGSRSSGAELWRWLERGAHLYVCGDAKRMARDVDEALRRSCAAHGGMSGDAADAYVAELARAGRYQRDVY